ncbi:hypothetical protein Ddye_011673 [Dipteronia dyeriana]|uniref:Transcriptional adapter 1 n=1 Tax=Dipteronia dyeriana TaxID=168575 RepID=A0AAD9X312_9ROSI|nr:hypothetical protein Ddye_011673 [Dipteronia dyeriana]
MQQPNQAHLRINLAELKAQLAKRLGPDRSKLYFYYLNKLLSLKLSKVEFNKFCLRVIGRENVKLHNKLIHSILENACKANVPPLASTQDENGFEITSGGYEQNGEVLLSSPLGSRSGISVGSDGDFSSRQSTITSSENGDLDSCKIHKPVQHHQVISKETNTEGEVVIHHPAKISGSTDGLLSVDSSSQPSEVLFVGDGKEPFTRSSIQTPLGIPFFSDSVGGACQAPHVARCGRCYSSYDSGRLPDTEMLKERMLEIVVAHGLEGIRSGHDLMGSNVHKHHSYVKPVNGGFPGYDFQISLPDFKVAMGLNPQQLGEDWPLLLERICICSHVE